MRAYLLVLLALSGCGGGLSAAGKRVTIAPSPPPGCRRVGNSMSGGGSSSEALRNQARNWAASFCDTIVVTKEHLAQPGEEWVSTINVEMYDCRPHDAEIASAQASPPPRPMRSSASPVAPASTSLVSPSAPATSAAPSTPEAPTSIPCSTPFVRLYTLASTAPASFDFPSIRAALVGHPELAQMRFIEGSIGSARVFGAITPDRAHAEELARVVAKGVSSSSPVIECATPKVVREVDLR